ncbi:MAG: enolase C-terminal domain-like protein [Polyangiaceae bacterium]
MSTTLPTPDAPSRRVSPVQLSARALTLPLKLPFHQASKSRTVSESVLVTAERGPHRGHGEGCPREYQTGETLDSALTRLRAWSARPPEDLAALREMASSADAARSPAAFCALETATLDLLARESMTTVESLLGEPKEPSRFRYTTVLGMRPGDALLDLLAPMGITDLKLKVGDSVDADRALLAAVRRRVPAARIRLDANNAFGRDAARALAHLRALEGYWAVEEPLAPGHPEATAHLACSLGVPIILDEALLSPADIHAHAALGADFIANIKVSRAGGLLRALDLVRAARAAGMRVIAGAQAAETSLLTRAGQIVARAAGDSLAGIEGALGARLLAWEPFSPSLQYGTGGLLDLAAQPLSPLGFGLQTTLTPEKEVSP